jgi:hypothetical protein
VSCQARPWRSSFSADTGRSLQYIAARVLPHPFRERRDTGAAPPSFTPNVLLPALLGHISARREGFKRCALGDRRRATGGTFALLIRRQTRLSRGVKSILMTGITVTTLLTSVATASAQNIFEALFGRLWNSPVATDAVPNAPSGSPEATRSEGGLAYCVRLCDGRYFPIQRHSGTTPAQTCSSSCPASATRIYNGNSIDHAVAPDGKRYSELATAFAYRKKIVPGCTCNGRDAFGLVNTAVADDPTLRPGDIVATNTGLMAYSAGPDGSTFMPISAYAGLSADVRRQLTETKIEPAAEGPAPLPPLQQAEVTSARSTKNKRAEADR